MNAVRTTCPFCGVGCGVLATRTAERALLVAGDPQHPANRGRLCSKGAALGATVGPKGRLLHPMIDGRRVGWDEAIGAVARRFAEVIEEHGPDAVAFYVSGQLLTEDYYAANKLMKGFIGGSNIDTNSRLCMASAVAAHTQAFGADLVPGTYEDIELADLVVLAGHNAAWTHPVLFQRIEAAARAGRRLVAIDPRRTDTAESCNLHLMLAPQTDVRLWNGLAAFLLERDAVDRTFLDAHVAGLAELRAALGRDDQGIAAVASNCGLAPADVETFYRWFAETPRTVSLFSQGSNQSAHGVAKGLAIINAHLLTGRVGKPGAAPFSITGQPNAMGGREVGGLCTQLAAHMGFSDEERDRVRRYWRAPGVARRPGLKAVDLFEAVGDGRIKALWIMATNPAVSLPEAERVRRALASCELVVVSEVTAEADTAAFADVLLPAAAWGEKDGTVTNSERMISRQRAALAPPGEARPDWRIVADVAAAMGFGEAFAWSGPADVFREWAGITAFENDGSRTLDLGGLAQLTDEEYDALVPTRWPCAKARDVSDGGRRISPPPPCGEGAGGGGRPRLAARVDAASVETRAASRSCREPSRPPTPLTPSPQGGGGGEYSPLHKGDGRLFTDGRFATPDGRARLAPVRPAPPAQPASAAYPFSLTTARVRDQWHTMTRTGLAAELCRHAPEPTLDIHPEDAAALGIGAGALAHVATVYGEAVLLARLSTAVRRGSLSVPMHWTDAFAPFGRANRLVNADRDPVSGQPEFKHTPARVRPWGETWRGFAARRDPLLAWPAGVIWRRIPHSHAEIYELAGRGGVRERCAAADAALAGCAGAEAEFGDAGRDVLRRARFEGERLSAVVCSGPAGEPLPPRAWIAERFGDNRLAPADRAALLLGRAPGVSDQGALVCACMGVCARPIERAIAAGAADLDSVGAATRAGANCGSCRTEIKRMLGAAGRARHAA